MVTAFAILAMFYGSLTTFLPGENVFNNSVTRVGVEMVEVRAGQVPRQSLSSSP